MATMDGIHDLGGMQGFGPVLMDTEELVFGNEFDRRTFRMMMAGMLAGHLGNRHRYAVERIDPRLYLTSSYYERWLIGIATVLVEVGVLQQSELDARLGRPFVVARPIPTSGFGDPGPSSELPRFQTGDLVRVREWHPLGHTRAPRYAQGKHGTVVRVDGVYSLPDVEMHCDGNQLEPTYSVRFEAAELWGSAGDP